MPIIYANDNSHVSQGPGAQSNQTRSLQEIQQENEYLREVIAKVKEENNQPRIQNRETEPQGAFGEVNRRSQQNN